MNGLKKILGILWIAIALIVGYFGIIILFVLTPIVSGGMAIFGYYALTGEYSDDKI